MNTMIKLVTILAVLNIFMYMAVNFSISAEGGNDLNKRYKFHFDNDLIDTFMAGQNNLDDITKDTKENWTRYDVDFQNEFKELPEQEAGTSVGTGGINFLDSLKIVWSFIATLGNVIVAPLTLFFNFRMPVFVGLMIGLPYFIMLIFTLFAFIRGVGD